MCVSPIWSGTHSLALRDVGGKSLKGGPENASPPRCILLSLPCKNLAQPCGISIHLVYVVAVLG